MAVRTRIRRSGITAGRSRRAGMDEHLAAIHDLLERNAEEQDRVAALSQLCTLMALMVGIAIYLVSRSPVLRAAKDGHGHVVLQPPAPDVSTIILVTLALITGAVVLARSLHGVAAGLLLFLTPIAIASCLILSGLCAAEDPETTAIECLVGAAVCVQYIALHRNALRRPTLLPVSLPTAAAVQLVIAVGTALEGASLAYVAVHAPVGYRSHPAMAVLGAVIAVAGPAVTSVVMRHVAVGFPRGTARGRRRVQ
jgi:hypothetical protein